MNCWLSYVLPWWLVKHSKSLHNLHSYIFNVVASFSAKITKILTTWSHIQCSLFLLYCKIPEVTCYPKLQSKCFFLPVKTQISTTLSQCTFWYVFQNKLHWNSWEFPFKSLGILVSINYYCFKVFKSFFLYIFLYIYILYKKITDLWCSWLKQMNKWVK